MWVIVFFLAISISSYAMYRRYQNTPEAFVWASLWIGGGVAISTEILSLFSAFRIEALIGFWGLFCVAILIRHRLWQVPIQLPRITFHYWLIPIGGILALTLLNALISPPNTYDSMTYHMARITYWEQYGSVAHFPTPEARQLYQHPFAEYIIAHLQILSDGDRFANLPQWFAYLGSLILLVPISQQLGADKTQTRLTVLIGATIPMAITQATSTQNDLVTAYWVLCSVYFALSLRESITLPRLIGLGIAVGLALLTKGTAYVYLAPILVWLTLTLFFKHKFSAIYKLAIAGTIAILFFTPHLLRNRAVFDSLTGPHPELYLNNVISPAQITSNIIRNIGMNYATPFSWEPSVDVARAISQIFVGLHTILDIPLNDPATTMGYQILPFPVLSNADLGGDDGAPAFFHATLIGLALLIVLFRRKFSLVAQYSVVCVAIFLLFSLILKWQPWHTRLHLTLLLLYAPLLAVVLNRRFLMVVLIGMVIMGYYWAFRTPLRIVIGENSTPVTSRQFLYRLSDTDLALAQFAVEQDCPIGFHFRPNTTEYLLHVALKQYSPDGKMPEIGHVFARWASDAHTIDPCIIIANRPLPETEQDNWYIPELPSPELQNSGYVVWFKHTSVEG